MELSANDEAIRQKVLEEWALKRLVLLWDSATAQEKEDLRMKHGTFWVENICYQSLCMRGMEELLLSKQLRLRLRMEEQHQAAHGVITSDASWPW